jgi:hypothetical protein
MGGAECTTLALEEECDDLIGVTSGGCGFELDGSFIVLTS